MTNPTPRELALVEAALKAAADKCDNAGWSTEPSELSCMIRSLDPAAIVASVPQPAEQALKLAEELVSLSPTGSLAQYKAKDLLAAIQSAKQSEDERAELFARKEFSPEIDWSDPANLGATAVQRAYFRTGWQAAKRDALTQARELTDALSKIFEELNTDEPDAPGHCHTVQGKWDADGSVCEWCATWNSTRALLSASKGEK